MMFLGAILFVLVFVMLAPQSRAFMASLWVGLGAFITAWAPFSYLLVLIVLGALLAGFYLIKTWPVRVDPENPMAKYRRDPPLDEE